MPGSALGDVPAGFSDITVSADRQLIVGSTCNEDVRLLDAGTGAELHTFNPFASFGQCIRIARFMSDGNNVLISDGNGVGLYSVFTLQRLLQFTGHAYSLVDVAISPNGNIVVTSGQDINPGICSQNCASAKLYDATTAQLQHTPLHDFNVTAVDFYDDNTILTASTDGLV